MSLPRTSKDLNFYFLLALPQNLDKNQNRYKQKNNSFHIPKEIPPSSKNIPPKFLKTFPKDPNEFPKKSPKISKNTPQKS